jgi:hypothetical protein
MPAAIAEVIYLYAGQGFIFGSAAAISMATATAIAYVVVVTATLAYSNKKRLDAQRDAQDKYNSSLVDRLTNVRSTVSKRHLCLGTVRKGGTIVFTESIGQYRERFTMVIALAGHEIQSIDKYFLNDVEVQVSAAGAVVNAPYYSGQTYKTNPNENPAIALAEVPAGALNVTQKIYQRLFGPIFGPKVTSYYYEYNLPTDADSRVYIRKYLGTQTTADAKLIADYPTLWDSAHIGNGLAYIVMECIFDETAFPTGLPNLTVQLKGAKCYDPRTGATAYTDNPALLMRHVLTHPYFGKRSSMTVAEDARISAAANVCDQIYNYEANLVDPVTGNTSSNNNPVKFYRAALVAEYGTSCRDILDDLAQAMGGMWADVGGEFFVKAGTYSAPVMDLTESDLVKLRGSGDGSEDEIGHEITVHQARANKLNQITVSIYDESEAYKLTNITPLKASALVTADGALLSQEVNFPAVFYKYQALHLAGIILRDMRDSLSFSGTFKFSAYQLEMFDIVRLTLPEYGFNAKEFLVIGRRVSIPEGVELRLKEISSTIFQPDASFSASGFAQNSELASPWKIEQPVISSLH